MRFIFTIIKHISSTNFNYLLKKYIKVTLLSLLLLISGIITTSEGTLRWSADSPIFLAPVTHYFTVDRTRDAIMQFRIQFWQHVLYNTLKELICRVLNMLVDLTVVYRSFGDISNCSGFYNVTDDKFFYCLVFWDTAGAICATHWLHVSTSVFGTTSISSFTSLKRAMIFRLGCTILCNRYSIYKTGFLCIKYETIYVTDFRAFNKYNNVQI